MFQHVPLVTVFLSNWGKQGLDYRFYPECCCFSVLKVFYVLRTELTEHLNVKMMVLEATLIKSTNANIALPIWPSSVTCTLPKRNHNPVRCNCTGGHRSFKWPTDCRLECHKDQYGAAGSNWHQTERWRLVTCHLRSVYLYQNTSYVWVKALQLNCVWFKWTGFVGKPWNVSNVSSRV